MAYDDAIEHLQKHEDGAGGPSTGGGTLREQNHLKTRRSAP